MGQSSAKEIQDTARCMERDQSERELCSVKNNNKTAGVKLELNNQEAVSPVAIELDYQRNILVKPEPLSKSITAQDYQSYITIPIDDFDFEHARHIFGLLLFTGYLFAIFVLIFILFPLLGQHQ